MIKVDIPSYKKLEIENLVFDYNGTLAVDGKLVEGVMDKLIKASKRVKVYVITADTYGTVKENFKDVDIEVKIISQENGSIDKLNFIKELGSDKTIAVGNGNNDELMLKKSAVGVAVLGEEGLSTNALLASDVLIKNIMNLFDMIANEKRIIANLRK